MTTLKFETSQIIENLEFFVNLVGVQQILDSIEPEYTDTKQFYNIVKDHVIFEDLCAICPKTFIKINGVEKFASNFQARIRKAYWNVIAFLRKEKASDNVINRFKSLVTFK